MGEVPAVSKEMSTPLHSLLDWTSRFLGFVRARAHVLFDSLILYSSCQTFILFPWHRGVPRIVGVVYKTPGLRY